MQDIIENAAALQDNENDLIRAQWIEYQRSGNIEIRNRLVLNYIGLVKKIAFKTFKNAWFLDCADELINEGVIAVINAIDRFDLEQNVKFETFVSRRIQGAMLDYIHRQSGFVRRIHEMNKTLNEAQNSFFDEFGYMPSNEETAQMLGISMDELDKILKDIQPVRLVSLNQPDNSDEDKVMEISSGSADDPVEILSQKEYNEDLVRGIEMLTDQQQLVLALFYKEEFSVKEIADVMKLTAEKVSQIRFQAIKKLKKLVADKITI